jgi:integrase
MHCLERNEKTRPPGQGFLCRTTLMLSNGVSIESVSKMLGHKNLRTTQHYAKILNRKVSEDMQMLREKLQLKNKILKSHQQ